MPLHQPPTRAAGVSLLELLVCMAVLTVLAALAGPSFADSLRRYRLNAVREALIASMQLAKMEAIRRAMPVYLVHRLDCDRPLDGPDDWSCGWQVFVDLNRSGTLNAGEPILQENPIDAGLALRHPGQGSKVKFDAWGSAAQGQSFQLVPHGGTLAQTQMLCISSGDRIRLRSGTSSCS